MQTGINNLIPNLVGLYRKIASNGRPGLAIEVATYPEIFPQDGTTCSLSSGGITKANMQNLNQTTLQIDTGIKKAVSIAKQGDAQHAAVPNIRTLDFDTAFKDGRDMADICHGGVVQPGSSSVIAELFHPNIKGHQFLRNFYLRLGIKHFGPYIPFTGTAPADVSLLREDVGGGLYVVVGGSLFGIFNATEQAALGDATATITLVNRGEIEALPPDNPRDGTLLKDAANGVIYQIEGGQAYATGLKSGAVTVPGRYIDAINADAPAAVYDQNSANFEVYYNTGGQLGEVSYTAATSWRGPWAHNVSGLIGSPTAAYDRNSGFFEVFYNTNRTLGEVSYTAATGWQGPFTDAGSNVSNLIGSPTAVYDQNSGFFEVFYNTGGQLGVKSYSASTGWIGPFAPGGSGLS